MNHATIRKAFVGFYFTLAIVVLLQSVQTAVHALGVGGEANYAMFALATVEALAAVLFMIPLTQESMPNPRVWQIQNQNRNK